MSVVVEKRGDLVSGYFLRSSSEKKKKKRTILVTPSTDKHYSLPPGNSKVVTLARLACPCFL